MSDDETPLIPRTVLFGNPVKASPEISPDGTRLAWLAPSPEGVLNVWVRTAGADDGRQLTHDGYRGIRTFFWAEDDIHLLYLQDRHGDENFHVYAIDAAGGEARDLTPFDGVKAENIMLDRHRPYEMLVGLNRRNPQLFDIYRVNLATGEVTLDTENPGDVIGWLADPAFVVRGAVAMDPEDGSTMLRVRDGALAPWRDLLHWPFGDEGTPVEFSADGRSLYVTTTVGADTSRLVRVDLADGREIETLAMDPRSDVGGVMVEPESRRVQAVSFNWQRTQWVVLDPSVRDDFDRLRGIARGDFGIVGRDRADATWLVGYSGDDGPVAWYAYHRASGTAELLFVNQPALAEYRLARMEPLTLRARDGVELVAYLTLPAGADRAARPALPTVLLVHGGPWARDAWGYDPLSQWLANRGYAVLKVNFRGSTGYGKNFVNLGDREWGVGAMQHDLTDAVRWAIDAGIADPARVAIMGGSYGGYATLAGLAFTPELYACGVDIVGPSNLRTLVESIPPYWAPMKQIFVRRMGDVEADEELNRRLSPMYHADAIRAPLLIAQGANDPRVKIHEADQMVAAIRAHALEVDYVLYPDEGHGLARPENRLDFWGRVEEFLARHLGGRVEPWTPVPGATADLR